MKIRKGLKRTLAAALAVMLMGGMTDMSAFAQEVDETGTEPLAASKESGQQVTGARETLNCVEAAKNMSLEFFNEVEGAGNWAERMALPDYAAGLYNTLASGFDSAFVEDSTFSEDTAVKVTYSNGKEISFNGIEVLNTSLAAAMTDEEWGTIQENLSSAYIAFQRDYPGVFWLDDSPKVIRTCTEQTAEDGTAVFNYTVYFVLKTHDKDYDIRKDAYQSAEAVWAAVAERNQRVQEVFAGITENDATKAVVYFNDNLEAVAKSMGGDAESPARAWKLLCDNAGIPCVLAYGAGGALEAYVNIDNVWYAANEVKAAEESKAAEEEKKTEEAEKKADTEKKAESKQETPAARPAVRSVEKVRTAEMTTRAVVDTSVKFVDENGAELDWTVLLERVIIPQKEKQVFGNTWSEMVKVLNNGEPQSVIGYKMSDGTILRDIKFTLLDENAHPDAGQQITCRVAYTSVSKPEIGSTLERQITIEPKPVVVDQGRLGCTREYRTKKFYLQGEDTVKLKTLVSDKNGKVDFTLSPIIGSDINDDIGIMSGKIDVKLTLTGGNITNYVLQDAEKDGSYIIKNLNYTCVAQTLKSGDVEVNLEYEPFVYDGTEKKPKVTVLMCGEEVREGYEYRLSIGNNTNATEGRNSATVRILPNDNNKYTWTEDAFEVVRTFEIAKAEAPAANTEKQISEKYGKKDCVINVSEFMPDKEAKIIAVTPDKNIITHADKDTELGTTIKYTVADNASLVESDELGHIDILIGGSSNYKDFHVYYDVKVIDRDPQKDFKFENAVVKIPMGLEEEEYPTIPVLKTVEGSKVTYSVATEGGASIADVDNEGKVRPIKAGRVTIKAEATGTSEYYPATATYDVIVVPKKHDIISLPAFERGDDEYKLEVEKGISQTYDKVDLQPDEIEGQLQKELLELGSSSGIPEENIEFYDVTLMVRRTDENSEHEWEVVDEEGGEFPKGGLPIIIPIPENSNSATDIYAAVHMFTEEVNGKTPGKTENWAEGEVEELTGGTMGVDQGLRITVNGLSPIAVGWEEDPDNNPVNPDDPNDPTNPDDPNNPANPDDPNNPTDPNNPNSNTTTNDPTTRAANGTTTGSGTGTATGSGSGTGSGTGTGTTTGGKVLSALTGDNAQILVYAVLFVLTGAVICGLFALKKKPNAKKK